MIIQKGFGALFGGLEPNEWWHSHDKVIGNNYIIHPFLNPLQHIQGNWIFHLLPFFFGFENTLLSEELNISLSILSMTIIEGFSHTFVFNKIDINLQIITSHGNWIYPIFSITASSRDGSVRLWDCGSGTCLGTLHEDSSNVINSIDMSSHAWQSESIVEHSEFLNQMFCIFLGFLGY